MTRLEGDLAPPLLLTGSAVRMTPSNGVGGGLGDTADGATPFYAWMSAE